MAMTRRQQTTIALISAATTAACLLVAAPKPLQAMPALLPGSESLPAGPREQAWWTLFHKISLSPQVAQLRACLAAPNGCDRPELQHWQKVVAQNAGADPVALSRAVNAVLNYQADATGHWQGPLETLTGGGDCENFAILKMAALIALGVGPAKLHVVVLRARLAGTPNHALLAVEVEEDLPLLDLNGSGLRSPEWVLRYYAPETVFSGDGSAHGLSAAAELTEAQFGNPD